MTPEKNGEWTGSKRYRDPESIPWERIVNVPLTRGQIIDVIRYIDDGPDAGATPSDAVTALDAAFAADTRKATSIIAMNDGRRPVEAPTRDDGYQHDDWRERHPAFGVIGASRVTAEPGPVLFGADYRANAYMTIRIAPATLSRGLSHDRVMASRMPYVEVALTEAQWATFISTPNVGDGVPATIQWVNGEYVPAIPLPTDRREELNAEVEKHVADALTSIDEVLAGGKTSAKDRERLTRARMQLTDGLPFVAKSFDEHAEKTVEKMKIDVGAWMTGAIARAGLEALGGVVPPIQLDDPSSSLPSAAAAEEDGSEAGSATR